MVLFESSEIERPLPRHDPRARHIEHVLRLQVGESFDCGVIDGPRGRATIAAAVPDAFELAFAWLDMPATLEPVTLLVGLPRPQTARKILFDATTLGVARIVFFRSQRGEPSYADSSLWTSGEVRRRLVDAAQQAFCTRLPQVVVLPDLRAATATLAPECVRVALDNYESSTALQAVSLAGSQLALALGSERGWAQDERVHLREFGFTLAHLGPRVLRTETATVAALAIIRALKELP